MATAVHNRPVTPTLDERIRHNNARPISPAAARKAESSTKSTSAFMTQFKESANAAISYLSQQIERFRGTSSARPNSPTATRKTESSTTGTTSSFMTQLKETADAATTYLGQQMERFGAPQDMMRNNLYTAVGAAIVAVLIGTILLAYSLFSASKAMPASPSLLTKSVLPTTRGQSKLQGFSTMKDKPKSADVDMGFSTWDDAPDMGFSTWDDAPDTGFSTWADAPKQTGFGATVQPIKDAILNAKDKVVQATGIDSASTQIKDFASKTMKSAEELGENVRTVLGDAYEATKDAAMHAADVVTNKGEELAAATKKKAEELTGMAPENDSKTAIKSKTGMKQNQNQSPKKPMDDTTKKTTGKSQSKWKLF